MTESAQPVPPARPRFKPYPAYKDSRAEWLGEIPARWQALKLKRVCSFAYGDSLASESRVDGEVEVYGSNGPVGTHERANTLAPCLVIGRKGSFGKVNYSSRPVFAIDTTYFVDSRFTRADLRWLYYILSDARLDFASKDSAIPGLDREDAYARDICACSEPEQRAIAAFLDRETARIDGLVAKKERLLELLQEQRTALITRAVTKGLDPTVPMKGSGVEWLGEIPAHWELVPSTWLFRESKQRALDSDQQLSATQKYGVILQAEFERLEGRQVVHAFLHLDQRKHVEVDDFVMSMRSFEGGLERVRVRGCVRSSYVALRSSRDAHVGFFSYLFKSSAYIQALRATSNFIRDGQDLNFENFRLVRLPLVRVREQESIAAFLDRETARIDALVAKVRDAIDCLEELRTALVSAAVTGKIDVREKVA